MVRTKNPRIGIENCAKKGTYINKLLLSLSIKYGGYGEIKKAESTR